MATMNMPPKKENTDEADAPRGNTRPVLHRYRLQVDRQTKDSFKEKDAAEKAGKTIKKAYPVVQVAICDAESEERTLIEA